jgi:pimeloyl-ACP methyl ester carboxylesterase
MNLVFKLPHYIYPAKPVADAPVLLFLHGIGECFVNNEQIGPQNLFQQGPPKHLGTLSSNHPLRSSFTLIIPQLPDRETSWSDVVEDVKQILISHRSDGAKLYIFGFSKGGLGAFQVANQLSADALVTVDASPLDLKPEDAINKWVRPLGQRPFWAIHTSYAPDEHFRKIQEFNELLTQCTHNGLFSLPKAGEQWRSVENAPIGKNPVERHVWICDEASKSIAPYNWLLRH